MFCLRSWIPILFFLTNASPIYLVLFISATYVLNRPCVYCSVLLAVLVFSLFDFQSDDWFEPRYRRATDLHSYSFGWGSSSLSAASPSHSTAFPHHAHNGTTSTLVGNLTDMGAMMVPDAMRDALTLVSAAVNNGSVGKVAEEVANGVKGKVLSVLADASSSIVSSAAAAAAASGSTSSSSQDSTVWATVGQWTRGVLKREWRIECLDVVLRL